MTSPVWSLRRSFLRSKVVPLMSVPLPEVSSTNTSISGGCCVLLPLVLLALLFCIMEVLGLFGRLRRQYMRQ